MNTVHKIINSDIIGKVIEIPAELKHKMVEVTITLSEPKTRQSLSGKLSKYSDKNKQQLEKNAWPMSVKDEKENY